MTSTINTALQVMELFPTPIFIIQTDGLDHDHFASLIYAIRDEELRKGEAQKTGLSNVGGFRSYDLLPRPGFDQLKRHILMTLNDHMVKGKWFAEPAVVDAQFDAMWGVINGKGHSNSTHNHPDAWISGVYYAKVPHDTARAGSIGFRDPILARTYTRAFYRSVQAEVASIQPAAGKIVMFPGWCEHFVGPNLTDEDRIAISFNIAHPKTLR
jgi:uncharacterized protein (TIGR02466 family)